MTANELIYELRDWAKIEGPGSLAAVLNEAADMIESLDERVSIMMEGDIVGRALESGYTARDQQTRRSAGE